MLVLLACWRQQEAVSPLDVTRWALDGHLPYLSFAAEEGAGLAQYRNTLGSALMIATGAQVQCVQYVGAVSVQCSRSSITRNAAVLAPCCRHSWLCGGCAVTVVLPCVLPCPPHRRALAFLPAHSCG